MLNRVLDRSIGPSAQAMALVEHAINALPGQLAALRGEGSPGVDLQAIVDTADRLAEGELASVPSRPLATTTVRRVIKKRVTRRIPAPPLVQAASSPTPTPVEFEEDSTEIVAGPLPGLDPVLFDILKSETAMHLSVVDEFLARASAAPLPVSEPVLRAAHTLSGAIAMVEIDPLSQVLSPLEGYLKRMRESSFPIDGEGIAVLGEAATMVREVMACLDRGNRELPDTDALTARITELRDTLHEPASSLRFYHQDDEGALADDEVEPLAEDEQSASGPESEAAAGADAAVTELDFAELDLTAALVEKLQDNDFASAELADELPASEPEWDAPVAPAQVPADTNFDALFAAADALNELPDKVVSGSAIDQPVFAADSIAIEDAEDAEVAVPASTGEFEDTLLEWREADEHFTYPVRNGYQCIEPVEEERRG